MFKTLNTNKLTVSKVVLIALVSCYSQITLAEQANDQKPAVSEVSPLQAVKATSPKLTTKPKLATQATRASQKSKVTQPTKPTRKTKAQITL